MSQAAGFINLIPIFGVLLGILILGDRLNPVQWQACGLVFSGVWISSRRKVTILPRPAIT